MFTVNMFGVQKSSYVRQVVFLLMKKFAENLDMKIK